MSQRQFLIILTLLSIFFVKFVIEKFDLYNKMQWKKRLLFSVIILLFVYLPGVVLMLVLLKYNVIS